MVLFWTLILAGWAPWFPPLFPSSDFLFAVFAINIPLIPDASYNHLVLSNPAWSFSVTIVNQHKPCRRPSVSIGPRQKTVESCILVLSQSYWCKDPATKASNISGLKRDGVGRPQGWPHQGSEHLQNLQGMMYICLSYTSRLGQP